MMSMVLDICLVASVLSMNALLWAYWYVRYVRPPVRGGNGANSAANETDEETVKKERLAKEWANLMNYSGNEQGGDER